MSKILKALPLAVPFLLSACASAPVPVPVGPSVLVLPAADQTFDQFVGDDAACRQFAAGRTGARTPSQASAAGDPASSRGDAGSNSEAHSAVTMQEHYDIGYLQCMYAKGHRVPVDSQSVYESRLDSYPPPPPPPPVHSMAPAPRPGARSR